jgi:hypothetical protein
VLIELEVTVKGKRMKRKGIFDAKQHVWMAETHVTQLQLLVDVIIHKTWWDMRTLRLQQIIFWKSLKNCCFRGVRICISIYVYVCIYINNYHHDALFMFSLLSYYTSTCFGRISSPS